MKRNERPGQTVLEYARANGLTVDWIYRLARMGKIAHVRLYGRVFITEPNARPGKATTMNNSFERVCPQCKRGDVVERLNKRTGQSFYGCSRYPECRFAVASLV